MTDDVFARVETVFHEALEREPGARDTYLDEACEGDAGLRVQVDRLLDRYRDAGEFLETPPMRRVVEVEAAAPQQIVSTVMISALKSPWLAWRKATAKTRASTSHCLMRWWRNTHRTARRKSIWSRSWPA